MFSGVKTKYKTLGYDSTIDRYNSSSMLSATEVRIECKVKIKFVQMMQKSPSVNYPTCISTR